MQESNTDRLGSHLYIYIEIHHLICQRCRPLPLLVITIFLFLLEARIAVMDCKVEPWLRSIHEGGSSRSDGLDDDVADDPVRDGIKDEIVTACKEEVKEEMKEEREEMKEEMKEEMMQQMQHEIAREVVRQIRGPQQAAILPPAAQRGPQPPAMPPPAALQERVAANQRVDAAFNMRVIVS